MDEAVKSVQEQIDSLPTADELAGMEREAQQKVYNQLQTAYDAYEALNEEQKAQIKGAEIFDNLFEVFNGMTNALADTGVFVVTGGTLGKDYIYTAPPAYEPDGAGILTVNTDTHLTISTSSGTASPANGSIVIKSGVTANITLAGLSIKPAENSTNDGIQRN